MYCKADDCLEHPLGILCQCTEYQKIIDEFKFYTIGTQHYLVPTLNIEPVASAKVVWIRNRITLNEHISKPMLVYEKQRSNINACNVDKIWIPVLPDLVPLKVIKPLKS